MKQRAAHAMKVVRSGVTERSVAQIVLGMRKESGAIGTINLNTGDGMTDIASDSFRSHRITYRQRAQRRMTAITVLAPRRCPHRTIDR